MEFCRRPLLNFAVKHGFGHDQSEILFCLKTKYRLTGQFYTDVLDISKINICAVYLFKVPPVISGSDRYEEMAAGSVTYCHCE
jgi:hypothetical protein